MTKFTNKRTQLSLVLAAVLASSASLAVKPEFRTTQRPVDGQYIVVLKDGMATLANERGQGLSVASMAQQMASQHGAQVRRSFTHALRGFVVRADDNALAKLLNDDRVAYVEEDGYVSINATQSGATWGIDRVDQRDLPLSTSYTYDTTASGVHAYIVDTGVLLSHNEFTGRMGNGYDAVTSGGNANDCNGHGTHVAGTVGGTTYGVAKGVTIHPVRVLGCDGSGTNSGVIAGMDWVAANHIKPAVANMSLGGGASTATDDAVARMVNAGVTVAVAAGNDNANACNYSPARAASAITVGSTTNTDARSSFSNFGTCLDIFGPGSSITSAWYTSSTATNTISGTSMASPHVAGVAALYLAANPTATPAAVTTALINASTPNKVTSPGTGSPNRLLYSIFDGGTPTDTTAPSVPSALSATAASSSQINLSWAAATDTGGSGLAGYKIERCQGAGCTTFAEIGTTSSTSYSNTGLAASTAYSYRIRAYDGAGNNSGYSTTASATTQASGGGGSTLTNGVAVTNISGATNSQQFWTMTVPAGATNLKFVTSGGTGDADLYVRFGSAPTTATYTCRSNGGTNAETCNITTAQAGTYHVMVLGYTSFSGLSLTGSFTAPGAGAQTYTNASDFAIGDNTTINSTISVSGRSGNAPSTSQVKVDIKHTYQGDLKVDLVAPDGSVYVLHNRTGAGTDNINTTYTVNLSTELLNGTWTLRVNDNAAGDTGFLDSWSLTF